MKMHGPGNNKKVVPPVVLRQKNLVVCLKGNSYSSSEIARRLIPQLIEEM
jgi:hypothetical protein